MQAYHLTAPSLDALTPVEIEAPRPGFGEVLLRLRAASLNYLDVAVAKGAFPVPGFPLVPVADGAGEIAAIGEGVTGRSIGDRVVPHFFLNWHLGQILPMDRMLMRGLNRPGSLAQFVVVPADSLVALPAALSFEEAATLPIAATTAWNAVRQAKLAPGATVLLLGTGGVSLFALQFAKASGARVIIISSSEAKLERAGMLGADGLINYRDVADWDTRVLELTDGCGADLVVETVGPSTFSRSLNAAAIGATICMTGMLSGSDIGLSAYPVMLKNLSVIGNNAGSVADLTDAVRAIDRLAIKPVVDRVFEFNEAVVAYRFLASGGHFGKVAITI